MRALSALAGLTVSLLISGQSLAQRRCDAILPYLQETEFVRNSEFSQEIIAARISSMNYSEFRNNFQAGVTIPVKGIPVSGSMSEAQFNRIRQEFSQSVDVNRVRSNESTLLRVRPNQGAINAWSACVARDRGVSIFLESRQDANEFTLNIRYDRYPGGASSVRISDLSLSAGVRLMGGQLARFLPPPYNSSTQDNLMDGSDIAFIIRRERNDQPIDVLLNAVLPGNTVISDRASIPVIRPVRPPALTVVNFGNLPIIGSGAGALPRASSLTIGDQVVSNHVLMNPRNPFPNPEIRFDLGGRYESFSATFGLYSASHPDCQYGPSVTFTILRDGVVWAWPNGDNTQNFRGTRWLRVVVPVSGVQQLSVRAVWGHGREHCADGAFGNVELRGYL